MGEVEVEPEDHVARPGERRVGGRYGSGGRHRADVSMVRQEPCGGRATCQLEEVTEGSNARRRAARADLRASCLLDVNLVGYIRPTMALDGLGELYRLRSHHRPRWRYPRPLWTLGLRPSAEPMTNFTTRQGVAFPLAVCPGSCRLHTVPLPEHHILTIIATG
jgi:hypothetical protein